MLHFLNHNGGLAQSLATDNGMLNVVRRLRRLPQKDPTGSNITNSCERSYWYLRMIAVCAICSDSTVIREVAAVSGLQNQCRFSAYLRCSKGQERRT